MSNGFIVYITNKEKIAKEIKLFSEELPDELMAQSMDGVYDFKAFQLIAKKNPFKGNSLTTGSDEAIQIEIVNMDIIEKITLNGRYERPDIIIDGLDNYINVFCPPNSNFYIRLNSLTPEII